MYWTNNDNVASQQEKFDRIVNLVDTEYGYQAQRLMRELVAFMGVAELAGDVTKEDGKVADLFSQFVGDALAKELERKAHASGDTDMIFRTLRDILGE